MKTIPSHTTYGPRGGVTLTEVLMSLMIMSVGVGLVATLFPIAALRSAQATKMTNAAIAKLNIEAMLDARPEIIFDPDGDFVNSSSTATVRWDRLTEHFRSNAEKNYIVDPSGYFEMVAAGNAPSTISLNGANGVIDAMPASGRGMPDYFGNVAIGTPYTSLPRYDGGIRSGALPATLGTADVRNFETLAAGMTSLGDGWDTVVDAVPIGFIDSNGGLTSSVTSDTIGVQFSEDVSLDGVASSLDYASALAIPDPELVRITVFRGIADPASTSPFVNIPDGTMSQSYPLTARNGQICVWTELAVGPFAANDYNSDGINSGRPLPLEFLDTLPARVVIQQKRVQDFNWLLTVRRGPDGRARGVDVVVMFNSGRKPENERVFPAIFTNNSFGVSVAATSGVDSNGDPAEPFLKRGGWVLDVDNARWYRIANYKEHPSPVPDTTNPSQFLVTLESAAAQTTPGATATSGLVGGAMFIPGIVDVYPLGSRALPDEMIQLNF